MNRTSVDYPALSEQALERFDEFVSVWLPDGDFEGDEYVALNPTRADNDYGSFKVNSTTGAWADFALDEEHAGGDLVSLVAYLENLSQLRAALRLRAFLADPEFIEPVIVDESDRGDQLERESARMPARLATGSAEHSRGRARNKARFVPILPVPNEAPAPDFSHRLYGQPERVWCYVDEAGRTLCYVTRFASADGGKEILPYTYCEDTDGSRAQWRRQGLPAPRPLYGLDRLADNPSSPVIVTEGEKAADAADTLFPTWVATTTLNGARGVSKADLAPLAGREVYIWPDADEAGQRYADSLCESLGQLDSRPRISVMRRITERPGRGEAGEAIVEPGDGPSDGWDAADAVDEGWTPAHFEALADLWIEQEPTESTVTDADAMPSGYRLENNGLYFDEEKYNNKGEFVGLKQHWLASHVRVVASSRDSAGENWGTKVEIIDRDGQGKYWCFPNELLHAPAAPYRTILASLGASLAPGTNEHRRFAEYLIRADPRARVLSVEQPGWHGDLFVLPIGVFGERETELAFQTADPSRDGIFAQAGSLDDWRRNVASPCQGNSRLIFALATAFLGPMLRLIGAESGGFHFRGPSSIGKSTLLRLASSVWGGESFMGSWRATDNGLEGVASLRNDTLLTLDELQEIDARLAGEAAYMLANGVGKSRSTQTGAPRRARRWRVVFLSSGELSLESHMASAHQRIRAGQQVRLVDMPADAGTGCGIFDCVPEDTSSAEFAIQLRRAAESTYGVAGPAWLELLTSTDLRSRITEVTRTARDRFIDSCLSADASGQARRICERFGLVAGVGHAAASYGILPFEEADIFSAIARCYEAYTAECEDEGQIESNQVIAQVRGFIEEYGESRFPLTMDSTDTPMGYLDDPAPHRTPTQRAGFRKIRPDGGEVEYFVFPEVFKRDLCHGFSRKYVCEVLSEYGYLRRATDGYARSERVPGVGRSKRVYVLTSSLMNDGASSSSEPEEPISEAEEAPATPEPDYQL